MTALTIGFERTTETGMAIDEERREVARRLRSVDVNDILFDSELVDAIEHACGSKRKRRDFGKIIERLADLIEPRTSEQGNPQESGLSASRIREAVGDDNAR